MRVIFGGQRIAFGGHARQDFVVGRDEGVASVRREEVEQFALAAANPLRSAETFQVRQADVGQDAVVRLGDRCQQVRRRLAPISTTPNSVSRVMASSVSGTPMWLLRLPRVA